MGTQAVRFYKDNDNNKISFAMSHSIVVYFKTTVYMNRRGKVLTSCTSCLLFASCEPCVAIKSQVTPPTPSGAVQPAHE